MDWQALSDSPWHHPGVAWLGSAVALALLLRSQPSWLRAGLIGIVVLSATDAFFTGALSPIPAASPWATPVSIAFVIAGDLRLWALVEKWRGPPQRTWAQALVTAVPLAFVVPCLQGVSTRLWPEVFLEQRRIFLVYEVMMVALLAVVLVVRRPLSVHRPTGLLTVLFLVQYALWASCDVIILMGHAWGVGLRLVPNTLYYGVFPVAAALLLRADLQPAGHEALAMRSTA